jgi:hypothetical protein
LEPTAFVTAALIPAAEAAGAAAISPVVRAGIKAKSVSRVKWAFPPEPAVQTVAPGGMRAEDRGAYEISLVYASAAGYPYPAEAPRRGAAEFSPSSGDDSGRFDKNQTEIIRKPEKIRTKTVRSAAENESVNIDQMVSQVYDQLEKRLRFDRRRTGLM